MKIAIANNSLRHGGAEHFTVTLANSFAEDPNNTIYLLTVNPCENEYPLSEKVNRVNLMRGSTSVHSIYTDSKAIIKFCREHELDTLVGIGIYPNLCVCLARCFLKMRTVISERNDPAHDLLSWKSKFLRWLLYRKADGIVFQTKGAQSWYSKSIQKKSVVIHNPVTENLPYRERPHDLEFVAMGRLSLQKDYPTMLQAFAKIAGKYSESKLRIFGQGKEKESLQKMVKELHLEEQVVFEGFCLNAHERAKTGDIFLMSSAFEGMPNALMEAMAMGFPVISTDCPSGGPGELIENGVNGILVPVGDAEAMSEQMLYLIEHGDVKDRLGDKAVEIRTTHSTELVVNRWKAFLLPDSHLSN